MHLRSLSIFGVFHDEIQVPRPLNLTAMSVLRSGVYSQTQEIMHFPGASEVVFFEKPTARCKACLMLLIATPPQ